MDWTGGVRRRFAAGKKNSVLQKQKAHFAKARAALQITQPSKRASRTSVSNQGTQKAQSSGASHPRHGRISALHSGNGQLATSCLEGPTHKGTAEAKPARKDDGRLSIPPQRQTITHRAPSIVSISSARSTSELSTISRQAEDRPKAELRSPQPKGSNDEECLLQANRRRLLARTDWLGLAINKPVRMKVRSNSDKDHIAKRRRIDRSDPRKGKGAEPRAVTPLFDDPALLRRQTNRSDMQLDEILVKIGTDALVSQTQRSRNTHTSGRDSKHSTDDWQSLSEEPMLLGTEWDTHQSTLWPDMHRSISEPAGAASLAAFAGSQSLGYFEDTGRTVNGKHLQRFEDLFEHRGRSLESTISIVAGSDTAGNVSGAPQRSASMNNSTGQMHHDTETNAVTYLTPEDADQPGATYQEDSDVEDDDDYWKRILDIKPLPSSQHSRIALRSSSPHMTTPNTSTSRVVPHCVIAAESTTHPKTLAQTRTQEDHQPPHHVDHRVPDLQSDSPQEIAQSPSASLKRINRLAHQKTAPRDVGLTAEAEDEDLWRQFIIGSPKSSDGLFTYRDKASPRDDADDFLSVVGPEPSSFDISGLGTSDKATSGDTIIVPSSAHGMMSESTTADLADFSSEGRVSSVMEHTDIAREEQDENENDSIADEFPAVRTEQKMTNIHAPPLKALNPRRFKRPVNNTREIKMHRHLVVPANKAKAKFVNRKRSVYDLVDSDGRSVS